ncbi:MAG: lysophospholipid acyltransferase family protein [Bacteroidia bacterium]
MKIIGRLLMAIWKIWFFLTFASIMILLYPILAFFLAKRSRYKYAFACQHIMARWITWLSGIFIKKVYHINRNQIPTPCVIVANHASYLDIIVSYLILKKYYVFMAKFELNKAPLFKIFFKDMQISVNRTNIKDAHRAFARASEEIDAGHSVFIFPEGTIGNDNGTLLRFKNGPFKLAIDKQVPILPITFIGNWKILQIGGFFKSYGRPGICKAIIHKPISTKGMDAENVVNLREEVHALIAQTLEKEQK